MKTATVTFASDSKKEIQISGQNLSSEQSGAFIHIKDGDKILMSAFMNQVVYILFKE